MQILEYSKLGAKDGEGEAMLLFAREPFQLPTLLSELIDM